MTQRRKLKGLKNSYLCVCAGMLSGLIGKATVRNVFYALFYVRVIYIYDKNVGCEKTATKYNSSV